MSLPPQLVPEPAVLVVDTMSSRYPFELLKPLLLKLAPSSRVKPFVGDPCAAEEPPHTAILPTSNSFACVVVAVVPVEPLLPCPVRDAHWSRNPVVMSPEYSQTLTMPVAPIDELAVTVMLVDAPLPTTPAQMAVSGYVGYAADASCVQVTPVSVMLATEFPLVPVNVIVAISRSPEAGVFVKLTEIDVPPVTVPLAFP